MQEGRLHEGIDDDIMMCYLFIGSLVVFILLVAVLYSRFRLKQRSTNIAAIKQCQIDKQSELIIRLLAEKEWLLQEIHHRVKNNLQIVISLLNTQSAYLNNDDALQAIKNSQHRMHAMSLIHQKLYQSENLSTIDMSWYIHELVNYLRDCLDPEQKISFELDTDKADLDVSHAVPLGLILNESISNALKYAFPSDKKGLVKISFKKSNDINFELIIKDDGVGLPEGFDYKNTDSLGMSLMTGLSNQLDGNFELKNNNGLTVVVTFIINKKNAGPENTL